MFEHATSQLALSRYRTGTPHVLVGTVKRPRYGVLCNTGRRYLYVRTSTLYVYYSTRYLTTRYLILDYYHMNRKLSSFAFSFPIFSFYHVYTTNREEDRRWAKMKILASILQLPLTLVACFLQKNRQPTRYAIVIITQYHCTCQVRKVLFQRSTKYTIVN